MVSVGNLADRVLLDANPLEYVDHTRRISAVIVNGRYLSRTDLDQLLERGCETGWLVRTGGKILKGES